MKEEVFDFDCPYTIILVNNTEWTKLFRSLSKTCSNEWGFSLRDGGKRLLLLTSDEDAVIIQLTLGNSLPRYKLIKPTRFFMVKQ